VAGAAHAVVDGGAIARAAGGRGFRLGQFELGNRLDADVGFVLPLAESAAELKVLLVSG
jgi:hypothetical protein